MMMLTTINTIPSFLNTSEKPNTPVKQSNLALLQRVVESFVDGILIVTEKGEWVLANDIAYQICDRLSQGKPQNPTVPEQIWSVCRALLTNRSSSSNLPGIIESEIAIEQLSTLRVRSRWLKLNAINYPYILVILEDRYQSIQNLVSSEADKYGLTPREEEVWLLSRANYTRQEIAAKLHISLNTVKKHLKNIQSKRQTSL
jgi:DNA-binding CsgD family transcriptional regulator